MFSPSKAIRGTIHQKVVAFFEHCQGPPPEGLPETSQEAIIKGPSKRPSAPEPPQKVQQKQRAWEQATATAETVDGEHGRIEIRRYWQVSDLTWLDERGGLETPPKSRHGRGRTAHWGPGEL